ncbi:hypothetical protein ET495_10385 [Xylanimonas allomyrinae]|uniref:Ribosomally synthesized peptide with SipW-like signal peptide n=1 Tax=Xylanimonas allomyrinae TaxID=2509459 RepID=A0A4P6EZT5_9MICO|nr:hypothetical protein [Xylanimonas allomyrinae]QAY63588.1 hypothetical protein ET495_10385 [Xylanimonas allomyrinae]
MSGVRRALRAAAGAGIAVAVATSASGLWYAATDVPLAAVPVGGVWFAVEGQDGTTQYARAGTPSSSAEPIEVRVPGAVVAQAMDGPVVWRFTVRGHADGAAGLSYSVSAPAPELGSIASTSTMRVFPAGDDGCSAPPAPQEEPWSLVLQPPGDGAAGSPAEQEWCFTADGGWPQDVQHTNSAVVEALDDNGDTARAGAQWWALVSPGSEGEPDTPITITPFVTRHNDSSGPFVP